MAYFRNLGYRIKIELLIILFSLTILVYNCGGGGGQGTNWIDGTYPQYVSNIPDILDTRDALNTTADYNRVDYFFNSTMFEPSFNPQVDLEVTRCEVNPYTYQCYGNWETVSVENALQKVNASPQDGFTCCAKPGNDCQGDTKCDLSACEEEGYSVQINCKFEDGTDLCSGSTCENYTWFWDYTLPSERTTTNAGDRLTVVVDPDVLNAATYSEEYTPIYEFNFKLLSGGTDVGVLKLEGDGSTVAPTRSQDVKFIARAGETYIENYPYATWLIPANNTGIMPSGDCADSSTTYPPHGEIYLGLSKPLYWIMPYAEAEFVSGSYSMGGIVQIVNNAGLPFTLDSDTGFRVYMLNGLPLNAKMTVIFLTNDDLNWWNRLNTHPCYGTSCRPPSALLLDVPLSEDWKGTLLRQGEQEDDIEYYPGIFANQFGPLTPESADTLPFSPTTQFRTSPIRIEATTGGDVISENEHIEWGLTGSPCQLRNITVDYLPTFPRRIVTEGDTCSTTIDKVKMQLYRADNSNYDGVLLYSTTCDAIPNSCFTEYGTQVCEASCSIDAGSMWHKGLVEGWWDPNNQDLWFFYLRAMAYHSGYSQGYDQMKLAISFYMDSDNDGILDWQEYDVGFDACDAKSQDPNPDPDERQNDFDYDNDHDGLSNGYEIDTSHTNPNNPDTDGDGMPDAWEVAYGTNPLVGDTADDPDGDGVKNIREYLFHGNPLYPDTDFDGVGDSVEIQNGCSVNNADSDNDGVPDLVKVIYGCSCDKSDTDGDQMPDVWEIYYGLNPLSAADGGTADSDGDGLSNVDEYTYHTNPRLADTDGDGYTDHEELSMSGRDPTIHEEPILFTVFPGVAKPGDTITILGYRLRDGSTVNTQVVINGNTVNAVDCGTGDTVSICAQVPAGARNFSSPPIQVIATINNHPWTSNYNLTKEPYLPFKVVDDSDGEFAEKEQGPTPITIIPGDTTVGYGLIRFGDKDYYRFYLGDRTVLNVEAKAYDALGDTVLTSGRTTGKFAPDTYIEVLGQNADVLAFNDNAGISTTNSALNEIVLDAGTYYLKVTVPEVDAGNTSQGYYRLEVGALVAPYITDISPAIGLSDSTIVVRGANFSNAPDYNLVTFYQGSYEYNATITAENSTSLTVVVPDGIGSTMGEGCTIVVTNETSGYSSTLAQVAAHNAGAIYHLLDLDGLSLIVGSTVIPEHAFGSATLQEGHTAVGFMGDERGKFTFTSYAGVKIKAYMQFFDSDNEEITGGSPEVALVAPDGGTVSPYDTNSQYGLAQVTYFLPEAGTYTLIAQGSPNTQNASYYRMSYFYQVAPPNYTLTLVSTDYRIVPVVKGKTTLLDGITVQISSSTANVPIIFKAFNKGYIIYTDADGKATSPNILTQESPILDRITIFPAGHPESKIKFKFVLVDAYSADDWDGDSVSNADEITNQTNPFNPWSLGNGNTLDGYPRITTGDSDGDGLGNSVEMLMGTNPHALDSDTDGYPDGLEVANGTNPLGRDPAKIELIPLGFSPNYGETIRLYAVAKDYSGHFRRNVLAQITSFWGPSIPLPRNCHTNFQGICYIQAYADTGMFTPNLVYYYSGVDGNTLLEDSTERMQFMSANGNIDPVDISRGNNQVDGTPFRLAKGRLRVTTSTENGPLPGVDVTFSVTVPEIATPDGFENAKMSKKFTFGHDPFKLPGIGAYTDDNPDDGATSITVQSDNNGFAWASFYYGNTNRFPYHIKAKVYGPSEGNSVLFTEWTANGSTVGFDAVSPHQHYMGYDGSSGYLIYWYSEHYLVGKQIPFYLFNKKLTKKGSDYCVDNSLSKPCVYEIAGDTATLTWGYGYMVFPFCYYWCPTYIAGDSVNLGPIAANPLGQTSVEITIPEQAAVNYMRVKATHGAQVIYADTVRGFHAGDLEMDVMSSGAMADNILLKDIEDGGTVCPGDVTVSVSIDNVLSQYLRLDIASGANGLVLVSANMRYPGTSNSFVIVPGDNYLTFMVNDKAKELEDADIDFQFILRDPDTNQELVSKGGKIAMSCGCDNHKSIANYNAVYSKYIYQNRLIAVATLGLHCPDIKQLSVIPTLIFPYSNWKTTTCIDWAKSLWAKFNSTFSDETTSHDCGSNCYQDQCTEVKAVGTYLNTPEGNYSRSGPYGWYYAKYTGNAHDWVQAGFKKCPDCDYFVWRNYDPWFDICFAGPNPWNSR